MGLAASQGRMLMLTARKHDLTYQGQQNATARLTLADKAQQIADKYTEAMNNTIMQASIAGEQQRLTFENLTSQDPFSGLCMRLVDKDGNVVVPGEYIEVAAVNETDDAESSEDAASSSIVKYSSSSDFINGCMPDLSKDLKTELSSLSLADITEYFNTNYNHSSNITAAHINKNNSRLVKEGEKVLTDANINDPVYLQQMIVSGEYTIQQAQPDGSFENIVWQGSPFITEVLDTSDDAAAEAEYKAAMLEIQKKEKALDLDLKNIETEIETINKEKDSVEKVVGDNIKDSYGTFA